MRALIAFVLMLFALPAAGEEVVLGLSKDKVAINDRGWNVGRAVGDLFVAPQEFTVACANADQSAAHQLNVLFDASTVGDHD